MKQSKGGTNSGREKVRAYAEGMGLKTRDAGVLRFDEIGVAKEGEPALGAVTNEDGVGMITIDRGDMARICQGAWEKACDEIMALRPVPPVISEEVCAALQKAMLDSALVAYARGYLTAHHEVATGSKPVLPFTEHGKGGDSGAGG